jgi:D-amino peptidase
MKIYISADIEGVAGVPSWEYGSRKNLDYGIGRDLMAEEVNAAIGGSLDAGAKEIIVNDSHASMVNLIPTKIHRAAKLLQGEVKPWSMMQGMDKRYDAALFIGYHSMAGTWQGSMAHTYSGAIREARVNGIPFGEPGLNAAFCGYHRTPLVFLSGDEAATNEIHKLIPSIVTVAVKKGYGRKAVLSIHPEIAREKIREGVAKALSGIKNIKPFLPKSPYTLEIKLLGSEMADMCERIPGIKRLANSRISFKNRDYKEIFRCFLGIMTISSHLL